jgi:hypothetical protein
MRILPDIIIKAKLTQTLPMGQIFKDEQLNEFGSWALAYIPYGGADLGEIAAVADEVDEGEESVFYAAWVSAGDRLVAEAERALADGHQESAKEVFLRASCFYGLSYRPLYGEPVDSRLTAAFQAQIRAFDRGLALLARPVAPLRIPFEGTTLPAYLLPAIGRENETRPLLDGRIGLVQCPTLLTMAEHDSLSESAPEVYEALRCPKTLIRFTAAEGAGDHCEMQNRTLLNRRVLDWLDITLQS